MNKQQKLDKVANWVETWFKFILGTMIAFHLTSVVVFGHFYEEGWFGIVIVGMIGTITMGTLECIDWFLNRQ